MYVKDLCCATIVCNSGGRCYRKCKKRYSYNELLNADDLVIMSKSMEDLKEKVLESEGCTGK